ncbi:MAG: hypothetical protein F6K24_27515 [Okeania sp. SIO2D1]|nr:hypothetical protein [Okeania sp. SIO2D1]
MVAKAEKKCNFFRIKRLKLLSVIPNLKKVVTVLISKFRPAEKTTVAIFYEIGINALIINQQALIKQI